MVSIRLILAIYLLWPSFSWAACPGTPADCYTGTGPYTTIDCEDHTIIATIGDVASGSTINVPAGTCTWAETVSIPSDKTIALIGNGLANTIISVPTDIRAILSASANTRVSGFRFNTSESAMSTPIFEIRNIGWRVDHIDFHAPSAGLGCEIHASGADTGGIQPEGVFDHNSFNECRGVVIGGGTFATQNAAWADNSVIGTAKAAYFEDSVFTRTTGNWIDANYGGKYVARYNTVNHAIDIMAHSLQGAAERGTRSWEIYGNNIDSHYDGWAAIRGGTGLIFANRLDFSSESYSNTATVNYDNVRSGDEQYTCCGDNPPPATTDAGACDGTSLWDGNTADEEGWPCRDQIGRGKDSSLFDTTTYAASGSEPAYSWSNRNISSWAAGGNANIPVAVANVGSQNHIKPNRDYYDYNASFDGTAGVGCGTLAARPACESGCAIGVAYWATSQSCSDLTGMVGASPATPISGTLYKLTGDGVWTAYYTPYTYPHPLSSGTAVNSPSMSGGSSSGGSWR